MTLLYAQYQRKHGQMYVSIAKNSRICLNFLHSFVCFVENSMSQKFRHICDDFKTQTDAKHDASDGL